MNRESRRKLLFFTACMMVLVLAACGQGTIDTQTGAGDAEETGQETEEETVANESSEEEAGTEEQDEAENGNNEQQGEIVTMTFYYTDEDLLELVEEQHEVMFEDEEGKMRAVWDHLQHPQTDKAIALWENFSLNDMRLEGSTLVIDVSMHEGVYFGSSAEGFAIQTLLQTFAQVDGIEQIQLLVDGEKQETLAGHISIEEPISVDTEVYSTQ
ncbi:spore germination protein GerM [Caldalkalibacillus uzonensis]|uniref:Spore germination protein GerM n=1 Tax=Caldalkalibacillus uzonensis TaxID=353224 RepID=A0ABU0CPF2_9BACI|nr:GerMN domain-containing protein [Caldalkalibacillus uzonensis]MDQ0337380.1 spore germination protein GerM [Caldalkalibacillus uzonensis]